MVNLEQWKDFHLEKETAEQVWLSTKNAAKYISVCPNTLRRYVALGLIGCYILPSVGTVKKPAQGKRERKIFKKSDLDNFIFSNCEKGTTDGEN